MHYALLSLKDSILLARNMSISDHVGTSWCGVINLRTNIAISNHTSPEWQLNAGTISPGHYIVVHDESNFKPEHIQKMTYKLTHALEPLVQVTTLLFMMRAILSRSISRRWPTSWRTPITISPEWFRHYRLAFKPTGWCNWLANPYRRTSIQIWRIWCKLLTIGKFDA